MKGIRLYIILGGMLLILYIIAELNRPKVIDWTPTLDCTEKTPFGDYIAFNRLNDIFPGAEILPFRHDIYNVLANDSLANSSYIIIANYIQPGKPDYDELIKYVKKGNQIFIAANSFGKLLLEKLKISVANEGNDTCHVHFLTPALDSSTYYSIDRRAGDNVFYSFDTAKTVVIGKNAAQKANFIKMKIGKGQLYLCCNPLFFSNYSMLKPQGARYAATTLSFVKNTKYIAWDEYYTQGSGNDGSPMRVFFSHEPLLWAYYIALFSLLIFVVYQIKRRQRIIPVLDMLENSTVSFVTTVGQVYFEKRDNGDITRKKILYFLEHLRVQYNLKTNPLDEEFIIAFSNKTGVDKEFATSLVDIINLLNVRAYISDEQLIELNRLIEQFYIKSR